MRYHCKHKVEAMRWIDTDENREKFYDWFHVHDVLFQTHGPEIVMPEGDRIPEGEWVLWSHDEFITMDDESFTECYELTEEGS